MPVQKQTQAGERTRFKAFVAFGDEIEYVGLGSECAKEVATAYKMAVKKAKLAVISVSSGYYGDEVAKPHTLPIKTGKCKSVLVLLIPSPKRNCCRSCRSCR